MFDLSLHDVNAKRDRHACGTGSRCTGCDLPWPCLARRRADDRAVRLLAEQAHSIVEASR